MHLDICCRSDSEGPPEGFPGSLIFLGTAPADPKDAQGLL
jgi:hypothetical protein